MRKLSKVLCILLSCIMLLSVVMIGTYAENDVPTIETEIPADLSLVLSKYGNTFLNCTAEDLTKNGFAYGDIVTVTILDEEIQVPIVPTYAYVSSGSDALVCKKGDDGLPTGYISMAINMGNFAESHKIAKSSKDSEGKITWEPWEGVEFPISVTIKMLEKEGYLSNVLLYDLKKSTNREDYPDLTDREYVNFRELPLPYANGDAVIYRTASPIDPDENRNTIADGILKEVGVTHIINLGDDEATANSYDGFNDTYYSNQNIIYLNLSMDISSDSFKKYVKDGFKFIAENEGIFAVHCKEGKDRTGFFCAVIESISGLSLEEMTKDFLKSFENFFGVEKDTVQYTQLAETVFYPILEQAFNCDDITSADLAKEAEEYLLECGLTEEEIVQMKINLHIQEEESLIPENPVVDDKAPEENKAPNTGDYIVVITTLITVCVLFSGTVVYIKRKKHN